MSECDRMARDAMRIEGFARRTVSAPISRTDPTGEPAVGPGTSQMTRDALTSVVRTLFDMGMPSHEIGAVVGADQPMLVHRYLGLHGERLAERLADQLQILARIEQTLNRAMLDRSADHQEMSFATELSAGAIWNIWKLRCVDGGRPHRGGAR